MSLGGGSGELSRVLEDAGGDVCAVVWLVQGGVVCKCRNMLVREEEHITNHLSPRKGYGVDRSPRHHWQLLNKKLFLRRSESNLERFQVSTWMGLGSVWLLAWDMAMGIVWVPSSSPAASSV